MAEMFSYAFMRHALLAAVLTGALCSAVAFFVVLKRLSFLGVGISHTALAGIALGLVTGLDPFWCGSAFAVATALATGHISRRGQLYEDTVIGIFFAAGMALGVAMLSSLKGYYPEIFSLLFGNILSVSPADLRLLAAVAAPVLLFIALFFKELLAISFDEEAALASGLPVKPLYYGLLAAMALTVMISVKLVGIVLASALLVIPAAAGYRFSKNYRGMFLLSLATGIGGSAGGLILSYYLDLPSGAAIVLFMALLFAASLLCRPRSR
ncbi:MAG TPA: metal ABC transporter permease [Bacillota bacterium]|jgi:zinc transport system permease protein|nr:metal ABC transporter permease [Bacillota bacterium]